MQAYAIKFFPSTRKQCLSMSDGSEHWAEGLTLAKLSVGLTSSMHPFYGSFMGPTYDWFSILTRAGNLDPAMGIHNDFDDITNHN